MTEAVLTVFAAGLALTQPVPQIIRLIRTRSVAGVSAPTAWLGLVINLAWVAYGVARGLVPVAVLSAAYVVGYAIVVGLLVRGGNRRGFGAAVVATGCAVAVAATFGWTVLGTVLAITVGIQFIPQVAMAWRSDDLTALAAGTYVVCGLDGMVWGGYGLLHADGPLMLYGAVMVTVAIAVLVPQRRWAARTRAAAV